MDSKKSIVSSFEASAGTKSFKVHLAAWKSIRIHRKKLDVSCGGAAVFRGIVRGEGRTFNDDEDDRKCSTVEKIARCTSASTTGRHGFVAKRARRVQTQKTRT